MKDKIRKFSELKARRERRESINSAMSELIQQGKDCNSCVGHCCTFEHNSMQVSPLEALDVYVYLDEQARLSPELVSRLESFVDHFRLDKDLISQGSKNLRRYYTCPFYQEHSLGCSLDRDSKPYGCLAFNPESQNVSEVGFCSSNQSALEKQNLKFDKSEAKMNELLRSDFGIYWERMNLPNALLYLIKTFRAHQK